MWKILVCAVASLALCQSVFAAVLPGAGIQIQQIRPVPLSIEQKAVPEIRVQQDNSPTLPVSDEVKILVESLHLTGQALYSEVKLVAISGFSPGSELTLPELRSMATKIADHYHKNGYFVAQAYLPAQDILNGVVTMTVVEGHYGKITLNNQTSLSDHLANSILAGLETGDTISIAPLESRLLLLADLPGVEVKSTLVPGATTGASDLIVSITPGQRVTGEVDADNAGNRYTGEYRVGATVNLNNAAGLGDVASLRLMTSGSGLYYVRASYQIQVAKATIGAAYSIMGYELGKEFESLDANGTAQIATLYGSYPLLRTRANNLYAGLAFDYRTFQDKVDTTSTVIDRNAYVLMPGIYGDFRDNFGDGGLSSYSLTLSLGNLDIETAAARSYDAATAQTNGQYSKLRYGAMRLQNLTESITLFAALNGQFASKNLDVSEKMELGGMYAVRAYPVGEAYADQGYVLNLEVRLLLPKIYTQMPGQMHLVGLVDTGTVTINANPWTDENNSRTLSGAGGGFTWQENNNFLLRAYYAFKLGSEEATSAPDKSGRFWIQVVKYF